MHILPFLQSFFGWIYFTSWSLTWWPQVLLIHKRRTTDGLSPNFMIINIVGFVSYSIFTYTSYFVPEAAKSYKNATGYLPQVDFADVLFAGHGAVMCTVLILQLIFLPPRTPPNRIVTLIAAIFQLAVFLGLMGCILLGWEWYTYLRWSSYVKVLSTLVKHFPQYLLNRSRGSTVGWSYTMILLDIIGGIFSMAQQGIRVIRMNSWAPFTDNLAKTFLAIESIMFDIMFVVQHVLWYTDRSDPTLLAPLRTKMGDIGNRQNVPATHDEMIGFI